MDVCVVGDSSVLAGRSGSALAGRSAISIVTSSTGRLSRSRPASAGGCLAEPVLFIRSPNEVSFESKTLVTR